MNCKNPYLIKKVGTVHELLRNRISRSLAEALSGTQDPVEDAYRLPVSIPDAQKGLPALTSDEEQQDDREDLSPTVGDESADWFEVKRSNLL